MKPSKTTTRGQFPKKSSPNLSAPPLFVSDEIPLYYQLQSILMNNIAAGTFATDGRFPTEAELVQEYGVSRITVRQALRTLEEQGLIRREVGRGTFVNNRRSFTGTIKLEGSMNDLIALGVATTVKVLRVATVEASAEDAEILRVRPGSLLTRCTRVRFHHNEPYSHVMIDLPHEIGHRLKKADWKGPVSRVLQDKLKIDLLEAQQTIRASLADTELARTLGTRIGAALLAVDRVVLTHGARPVERVRTHYRSDIFCFSVHLHRDPTDNDWSFKKRQKSLRHGAGSPGIETERRDQWHDATS